MLLFIFSTLYLISHLTCCLSQQIFDEIGEYCEFKKVGGSADDTIRLRSGILPVSTTYRNKNKLIHVSLCGSLPPIKECKSGARVCIIDTKHREDSIANAGEDFIYTIDAENYKNVLRSVNGQQCSSTERFTVIIDLEREENAKEFPSFDYQDECLLRLKMLRPDYTPPCTTRVGKHKHLIDVRELRKFNDLKVSNPTTKSFTLSFCGNSPSCGSGIAMCETTDGIMPIGETEAISVSYNGARSKTKLMVQSVYHPEPGKKAGRKETEIHLNCNWSVQGVSNLRYIVPPKQGKRYKFEGESSLACIKLPMNCVVVDSEHNYFVYDLKSLNKPNGGWRITNTTETMYINVCGPLKLQYNNNVCTDQHSQVCSLNSNQFFNLGSIASTFEVTSDNTVKVFFTDGSVCATNSSKSYTTEIEFKCSNRESGPVLNSIEDCRYFINWETPSACPKNVATQDHCLMSDLIGNINLQHIHKPTDLTHRLNSNSYLRYNLCGTLNSICNHNNMTSICYIKNEKEHIVGYTNNVLLRNNTSLSLNLVGDVCEASGSKSQTKIYFTCKPKEEVSQIKVVKEDCVFEIHIATPLACAEFRQIDCKAYSKDAMYDLTALVRKASNYKVQDSKDKSAIYYLNVCHSIVNTEDLYCPGYSGACFKSLVEPDLKHMYKSMGNVPDKGALKYENGALILTYTLGSFCSTEAGHYSTKIIFECSDSKEGPKLLNKTSCSYTFIWRTREACPKQSLTKKIRRSVHNCTYEHPTISNKVLDFKGVDELSLVLPSGNLSVFVCEQNFSYCANESECTSLQSEGKMLIDTDGLFLEYKFNNACHIGQVNAVHLRLNCDESETTHLGEILSNHNCTTTISLYTKEACENEDKSDSVGEHISNVLSNFEQLVQTVVNTTHSKDSIIVSSIASNNNSKTEASSCAIRNLNNNFTFYIEHVNFNVTLTNGNHYSVAFGSNSNCSGFVCVNSTEYLGRTDDCPTVMPDNAQQVIRLLFITQRSCVDGRINLEIWLKCRSEAENLPYVQESSCKISIVYPLIEGCLLLEDAAVISTGTDLLLGVILGVVFFLVCVAVVAIVLKRKYITNCLNRRRKKDYDSFCCKERVSVYFKDSSL